jgi:glyoxylase-like metal-dependent hydrolase (beta-lactamase superfamily II)
MMAALMCAPGSGNVLWDCINVLTGEAKDEIRNRGSIRAIALSHPHFYTAMADWAEEFDAPVYVHEGDKDWVTQPSDRIQYWSGTGRSELNRTSS